MDDQEYTVEVSDAALAMLDRHVDFLANVSKAAATKMKNEVLTSMRSLQKNPQRYPTYDNPFITDTVYRAMLSAKRYLVFYEIVENTVYVDYVVDCRQDYAWLIR